MSAIVIFSKNRGAQLDLSLRTLFRHCDDISDHDVCVLYRTEGEDHEKSYSVLQETWKDRVYFVREADFKRDLVYLLSNPCYDTVLFSTDDNIWTYGFSLTPLENLLYTQALLGFSFRLGYNTTYCYSHNKDQRVPPVDGKIHGTRNDVLFYEWKSADYDFGYPVELSSSLYRVEDMMPLLKGTAYSNPHDLEWLMYLNLRLWSNRPWLACFSRSVAFCNPVNKVLSNTNRSGNDHDLKPDAMCRKFLEGFRLADDFNSLLTNACHQEFGFEWEEL